MLIDAKRKKNIWQNPAPIYNKALSNLGIEENFLNLTKTIYEKQKQKTYS